MEETGRARAEERSILERHRGWALTILVVGILLSMDVLFATIRNAFFDPFEIGQRVERAYRIRSETHHHDLLPNLDRQPAMWGGLRYRISTNSLGFKDRAPREVALETDRRRILFIGDSFTEGVGFPYEETFVGLVDAALADRGIEVLNAGVASYSPQLYFRKVRHLIEDVHLRFDELVVFIDVADIHDDSVMYQVDANDRVQSTEHALNAEPPRSHGLGAFVRENTIVTGWALMRLRRVFVDVSRKGRTGWETALWTVDDEVFARYGELGLANMERAMDRLAALLAEHDVALTVAVYPWPVQIDRVDLHSRHVAFWQRWARAHDAGFLDFFPDFVGDDDVGAVLNAYFIYHDVHWSAGGHRYMAEGFLEKHVGEAAEGAGSAP